ncbi:hypothetical protein NA57DRAFT_78971 [Rhizodiscina lignyota]|uniref:Uncharacterized protein n=1 Tax=Rhizodiscina lignyota TaxID=1504668 RepID=A0A9P4IAN5_9PEZI|nr:hypothetical protein NA57DRAFT_78971 [Rhizodiscina lignyota]
MNVCTRCWRSFFLSSASGRSSSHSLRRSFAHTARRSRVKQLPVFADSSSAELANLLQTIRERILIPGFLNAAQRDLIFLPKWKSTLENEDITAEIGDEEVPLRHLDVDRDIPRRWPAFKQAVEMSETEEDWRNMLALLEGLHQADAKITPAQHAKFIRRAIEADMMPIVIQAIRTVSATGVSLSEETVLEEVLLGGVHERAVDSGWSDEATEEAWTLATQITQLMEFPKHCGDAHMRQGKDLRAEPWVLGVLLEATAMRQKLLFDGKDDDGQVALCVDRLVSVAERSPIESLPDPTAIEIKTQDEERRIVQKAINAHKFARKLIPLWNGLNIAEEILGPTNRDDNIRSLKEVVAQRIQKAVDYVEAHGSRDKSYRSVDEWTEHQQSS